MQADKYLLEGLGRLIDRMAAAYPDWPRGKIIFNSANLTSQ